jgi:hypothetical protein
VGLWCFYESLWYCQFNSGLADWRDENQNTQLVWSKNSSSLAVSKKFKYFNADEFIEGTSF